MPEWKTTKSGYRYPAYEREEWADFVGDDDETYACWVRGCGVVTQGGMRGFREHMQWVHDRSA